MIQIPTTGGVMNSFSQEAMCKGYKSLQCSCPVAASGLCENKRAQQTPKHRWHVHFLHLNCRHLYILAFMLHPCENICLHAHEKRVCTYIYTHMDIWLMYSVFRCKSRIFKVHVHANMSTTLCPERSANCSAILQTIIQFARVCASVLAGRTVAVPCGESSKRTRHISVSPLGTGTPCSIHRLKWGTGVPVISRRN